MSETREVRDDYADIGRELIKTEPSLQRLRESSAEVVYLSSDSAKKSGGKPVLGQCEKVPGKWQWAAPYDYAVTVYEPNVETEGLTPDQIRILLHHELLHILIEHDQDGNEKYSIAPHDVADFTEIIRLYGVDWAQ